MSLIKCKECGKEISDQASSCPHCGCPINPNAQSINVNMNNGPSIKCPKCGSTNLQAISDTHGKGASFWKLCFCGLLGLCGTGKTKTEHYWVCQSCGNKFKM
ncbi:MAG: zinc-ribbon domain-containing protein [Lachnospiraceae bacterium]|nr:zinc-ribbon domain-containing protein [Lachnospiraceae bacterium]